MDNASFHRSDRIKQLCSDAGVKLLYLPPYSPDFNPIEEFFAELKRYIKKVWPTYVANPRQGFRAFLRNCVHLVGERRESAEGHFRHAGIALQYNRGMYNLSRCNLWLTWQRQIIEELHNNLVNKIYNHI